MLNSNLNHLDVIFRCFVATFIFVSTTFEDRMLFIVSHLAFKKHMVTFIGEGFVHLI